MSQKLKNQNTFLILWNNRALVFQHLGMGMTDQVAVGAIDCRHIAMGTIGQLFRLFQYRIGDIFDGRRYGFIFGLVQAVINLAGAVGAWLGGALFERYQSYDTAFLLSVAAWVLSCLFIWMAAPRKKFKAAWQAEHAAEFPIREDQR